MVERRSGRIVNICSLQSEVARPGIAAYSATKGAVKMLTKGMSADLAPFGINVNAIAPSLTLSPRLKPRWDKMTAQEQQQEVERVPLRRVAEPVDQARVICFLASSDADFVTGITIDVTGGS